MAIEKTAELALSQPERFDTCQDLERKGSVAIFLAVRRRGHPAGEKLLYALEAALLGLRPDRLPDVVQANLRERAGL